MPPIRDLADYPRPSVAVDVAVLTVVDDALAVLVVESPFGAALPGTFLHPGETLTRAANRALDLKAGITGLDFHPVAMFDDPTRDDRGWVLSMAHSAAVPFDALPPACRTVTIEADRPVDELAFDHADMVVAAVHDLRTRYTERLDPDLLAGPEFTLLDMRRLYDIVFDRSLPKDTFRRQVSDAVTGTGRTSAAGGGRPAELYRRTPGAELPRTIAALLRS